MFSSTSKLIEETRNHLKFRGCHMFPVQIAAIEGLFQKDNIEVCDMIKSCIKRAVQDHWSSVQLLEEVKYYAENRHLLEK